MNEMMKGAILGAALVAVGFGLAFVFFSASGNQEAPASAPVQQVILQPTAPAAAPPLVIAPEPTAVPSRFDCDAIRGTGYRTDEERSFFLANCVQAPTAQQASGANVRQTTGQTSSNAPIVLDPSLLAALYPPTPVFDADAKPAWFNPQPTPEIPFDPEYYIGRFDPPEDFCEYVWCVPEFWQGKSYVITCQDGVYMKVGSKAGACLDHDGPQ